MEGYRISDWAIYQYIDRKSCGKTANRRKSKIKCYGVCDGEYIDSEN